jgi:phospholipid/cholesterol/gamma-HCH transport system substrate-binding protein
MQSRGIHFFIGLFVVIGIIGIFATGLWLAKINNSEETNTYIIYFEESVSGLNVGSHVDYRGMRIGMVSYLGIKPDNPQLVEAKIEIRKAHVIHQGDMATLKLEGITGTSYINIEGARAGSDSIVTSTDSPGVIPSRKSELEQLIQGAPELIHQGTILAQRFSDVFNTENQELLNSILQNINEVTASLASQNEEIGKVFGTINKAAGDFSEITVSLNKVIAKADTLADKLNTTADNTNRLISHDGEELIKEWNTTAQSLNALVESADKVLGANEQALGQFSHEGLSELTLFLQESRILVAGLTRLADHLESSGARFLLDQSSSEYQPD